MGARLRGVAGMVRAATRAADQGGKGMIELDDEEAEIVFMALLDRDHDLGDLDPDPDGTRVRTRLLDRIGAYLDALPPNTNAATAKP
jgi:hypothetical protein